MLALKKNYAYDEIISRPTKRQLMQLNCVEGWSANVLWEGISLTDLLEESIPDANATTVILHGLDGYTSSLPFSFIKDNDILLAFKMNDVTLPAMRGFPFELAADGKWGYKWIKWINRIELSDNEEYRGYWESFGYNNDGSLSGPIGEQKLIKNQSFQTCTPF